MLFCLSKSGGRGEREEDLSNYRVVTLTMRPGKTLEHIIKQSVCQHLENNAAHSRSQHGFIKSKSPQINLISVFVGKVACINDSIKLGESDGWHGVNLCLRPAITLHFYQ